MATYAIGDIQGCLTELQQLLKLIQFNIDRDRLWLVGDLVNRGPDSLGVLRLIKNLTDNVDVVLGNHDLHLLAVAYGQGKLSCQDSLQDILSASDCYQLLDWLRQQPLVHYDTSYNALMVHAGIPHHWSVAQTLNYGQEVSNLLQSDRAGALLAQLYGDRPCCWHAQLKGYKRWRLIVNYLTRMRYINKQGCLELKHKTPTGYRPWFSWPRQQQAKVDIIFGHWAALQGITNNPHCYGLDTGCVWGGALTALRLTDKQRWQIAAHVSRYSK
jgi:bis(5'-nucleosyl)-tetraphosphatase (symmetrical)